jgi:hypothetical protein
LGTGSSQDLAGQSVATVSGRRARSSGCGARGH